nr:keratin-3, type I cytoskeletal 51 kDa-like [Nicotiana tomentosiformis]
MDRPSLGTGDSGGSGASAGGSGGASGGGSAFGGSGASAGGGGGSSAGGGRSGGGRAPRFRRFPTLGFGGGGGGAGAWRCDPAETAFEPQKRLWACPAETAEADSQERSRYFLSASISVSSEICRDFKSSILAPQMPPSVEETFKKLLENQNTIMAILVQHGSVIEELVTKLVVAGDIPFDMLIDPYHPGPDPTAPTAPASQSEKSDLAADTAEVVRRMFTNPVTPRVEDDEIQLDETEVGDVAVVTEMAKEP